jgi:CubicO group peptidase (beta-lactamase class C family)
VLVWAAEHITGTPFSALVHPRLWSKLGAEFDLEAACDSRGHWTHNLSMCLRDLARFGQMLLCGGRFNGHRIVPASFIDDVRRNASVKLIEEYPLFADFVPKGIGYRSFFWVDTKTESAFGAFGAYGQFCYICPQHDVVIAAFASQEPMASRINAGIPEAQVNLDNAHLERVKWGFCKEFSRLVAADTR